MANFFTENSDRVFHFESLDIRDIVEKIEDGYTQRDRFDYAPENYEDAMDNFRRLLDVAGRIAADEIAPLSRSVDEEGALFDDGQVRYADGTTRAMQILAQSDLMGGTLPRRFGGLNLPNIINNIIIEMVSEADASLMNIYGLQDIAITINKFGNEEQKRRTLPKFCTGEVTGSMDLTEAEAGSDLQAVQTRGRYDEKEDCWRLDGVKRFITNGCADVHLVLARSEENSHDARGLSMFLYERDDNMKIRRIEEKLGIHGSPTTELQFTNARAELVGQRKMGLVRYVMYLMNGARLGVSLQALGIAQAAYNKALKYAMERQQFGKKIIHFPPVYDTLTNNRLDLEVTRSLLYRTSLVVDRMEALEHVLETRGDGMEKTELTELRQELKKESRRAALLTPLAKYYATEIANRICYDAIQIHGGTGFMRDFDVERHYRDVRITSIYEGTTQLQVVAAIGGIVNGMLSEEFAELRNRAEGHEGEFQDVYWELGRYTTMFEEAVGRVQAMKDRSYHDYMSRSLVDMGLTILMMYMLLDEAKRSPRKALFAQKFAAERLPRVEAWYHKVKVGDETTIRNFEQLLEIKL